MVEEEKRRAWCASRRRANALIRDRNGVWYIDPCGAPPLAVNDYRHRLDNLPPTYPLPPISRLHPPPPFSSRRTQQSYQPYLGSSDHSATRKWVILHAITHAVSPLSGSTFSGQSLGWHDEEQNPGRIACTRQHVHVHAHSDLLQVFAVGSYIPLIILVTRDA